MQVVDFVSPGVAGREHPLGTPGDDLWGEIMLLTKTYTVLDHAVVEISCIHGSDPVQSHLVYRSAVQLVSLENHELVQITAEELCRAASLAHRAEVEFYDDCML